MGGKQRKPASQVNNWIFHGRQAGGESDPRDLKGGGKNDKIEAGVNPGSLYFSNDLLVKPAAKGQKPQWMKQDEDGGGEERRGRNVPFLLIH